MAIDISHKRHNNIERPQTHATYYTVSEAYGRSKRLQMRKEYFAIKMEAGFGICVS